MTAVFAFTVFLRVLFSGRVRRAEEFFSARRTRSPSRQETYEEKAFDPPGVTASAVNSAVVEEKDGKLVFSAVGYTRTGNGREVATYWNKAGEEVTATRMLCEICAATTIAEQEGELVVAGVPLALSLNHPFIWTRNKAGDWTKLEVTQNTKITNDGDFTLWKIPGIGPNFLWLTDKEERLMKVSWKL